MLPPVLPASLALTAPLRFTVPAVRVMVPPVTREPVLNVPPERSSLPPACTVVVPVTVLVPDVWLKVPDATYMLPVLIVPPLLSTRLVLFQIFRTLLKDAVPAETAKLPAPPEAVDVPPT